MLHGMFFLIFDYGCIIKRSEVNHVVFFVSYAKLCWRQNDWIHCQDFIKSWHENFVDCVVDQILFKMKNSRSYKLNHSIQQLVGWFRCPTVVTADARYIWLQRFKFKYFISTLKLSCLKSIHCRTWGGICYLHSKVLEIDESHNVCCEIWK